MGVVGVGGVRGAVSAMWVGGGGREVGGERWERRGGGAEVGAERGGGREVGVERWG